MLGMNHFSPIVTQDVDCYSQRVKKSCKESAVFC
jgi:hypothetical protein